MFEKFLITSAGGTVGRLIVEHVKEALPDSSHLFVADSSANLSHLQDLATPICLPLATSSDYTSRLLSIISTFQIDAILPLSEEECMEISYLQKIDKLPALYLGTDYDNLSVITDKVSCLRFLSSKNLDVPGFAELNSTSTLHDQLCLLGYPRVPVVFKPRSSRGSRGFRIISSDCNKLLEFSRKGGPIFIDPQSLINTFSDSPTSLRDFFLMEFLPGDSLSVDMVACRGKLLSALPHKRLGYQWGFVDFAEIFFDRAVNEYCSNVVSCLSLHGLCNIEVGYRSDGTFSLIEVNGRTSATVAQSSLLGLNSLSLLFQALRGNPCYFSFSQPVSYRVQSSFSSVSL